MPSFTSTFGGTVVYPADVSYRAVALSANVTLTWPTELATNTNVVASIMDVTPSGAGLTIRMPDATQVVETHFPRVGGHQDGSTRFYGIAGQLICLAGPVEVPSVWAAAATPDDFEALSSTLGFEWDYSSADD